jgi:spore coat polysaccharide biosynthesis protein SpsF
MKTVAVIQARMGSSRLPGKTLLPAAGKPLLELLIERLRCARSVDQVVVATTTDRGDDPIEALCSRMGAGCYRGSIDDVLGRVVEALVAFEADLHVEIHGDGPLVDPEVVDRLVGIYREGSYALVTNALKQTYPAGLETWVWSRAVAEEIAARARHPLFREHVALYLETHPDRYPQLNVEAPSELYAPAIYIEIDTPEDYEVVRAVFDALYPQDRSFTTLDVLAFLRQRPDIARANAHVVRRYVEWHALAATTGE